MTDRKPTALPYPSLYVRAIRAALYWSTVHLLTSNDIVEGINLRVGYTATGAQSSQGREPLYDSIGQFVTSNVLGWHSRI